MAMKIKNLDFHESQHSTKLPKSSISSGKIKILVWLDFGPYAYFNLGMILELSKIKDFEFIGITTIKKDYKFFKEQKLVKFEKLFYYPDCYLNKSSYDITKLKKFENKYKLNLWQDIFSERSFYKYWVNFHKFSKNEILSIIESSIIFFEKILKDTQPDVVIMQQPGENVSNLLLYKISHQLQIKTLMYNVLYTHDKIIISNNLYSREISENFLNLINNFKKFNSDLDPHFLQTNSFLKSMNVISTFNSNTRNYLQKIKYSIKRLWIKPEPIYINEGKTPLKIFKNKIKNYFLINSRKKFLELNSNKIITDKNFFYFPLQGEPESTVMVKCPYFSDVVVLIQNIAKSIPINYVLYVKEHPIQKQKSFRSKSVYQKIIDIPNVKLFNPDVNAQELISKSTAVFCLAGATGFEALFHKKPVILFSDEYYDVHSMVFKAKNFSELSLLIKRAIDSNDFNDFELNALLKATKNQSLDIPFFLMLKDAIIVSSIQNELNTQKTTEFFEIFFQNYLYYFSLIAKDIFKKIS